MTRRQASLAIFLGLVVLGSLGGATVVFDIDSSETVSIPERTVDVQGTTHTINSTITADPGASIPVEVTAPAGVYRVYIYNNNQKIVASKRGNGSGSFTFDLSNYDFGSYAVTVNSRDSGKNEAVLPLLIRGYVTRISAPASVTTADTFDVDVQLTRSEASSWPHSVKVVIADRADQTSVVATGSSGSYTASIDASELDTGTYTVYGIAQGQNEAFGRNEILGLSSSTSITVEEATPRATETGVDASPGGGGDETGGEESTPETATPPTDQPTPPENRSQTATVTATQTESPPRTGTETGPQSKTLTVNQTDIPTQTGIESATSTSDSQLVTPNQPSRTAVESTERSALSGLAIAVVVAAILLSGVLILRRYR